MVFFVGAHITILLYETFYCCNYTHKEYYMPIYTDTEDVMDRSPIMAACEGQANRSPPRSRGGR